MKAETHPLYEKLQNFPLDFAEDTFPFSRRLRKENGWTEHYTRRVLNEYRRFLFLAAVAGHPVAPPDAIDQAWHLHLVYTRSYWDELCGETLGFPLHHGPTRGGQAESDKFTDWYARTLSSYRLWFAAEPPADIWLSITERYRKERNRFQRIDLSENWVVPKRLPRIAPGIALLVAIGIVPFVLGASSSGGTYFLLFLVAVFVIVIVSLVLSGTTASPPDRRNNSGTDNGSSGTTAFFIPGCGSSDSSGHGHGHCGDSGGSEGGSSDSGSSGCGSSGCGSSGCGSSGCGGGC